MISRKALLFTRWGYAIKWYSYIKLYSLNATNRRKWICMPTLTARFVSMLAAPVSLPPRLLLLAVVVASNQHLRHSIQQIKIILEVFFLFNFFFVLACSCVYVYVSGSWCWSRFFYGMLATNGNGNITTK